MVDLGKMEGNSKSCADNSEHTRFSSLDKLLPSSIQQTTQSQSNLLQDNHLQNFHQDAKI